MSTSTSNAVIHIPSIPRYIEYRDTVIEAFDDRKIIIIMIYMKNTNKF